jgi:hypothetical protein
VETTARLPLASGAAHRWANRAEFNLAVFRARGTVLCLVTLFATDQVRRESMTVRKFSRRGFLELGAATGAAVLAASQRVHAAGSDVLKIGLVGCGGRGTGSLRDSLAAMPNVRVVALGDLF